ncbi:hypothetical protein DERP_013245 [Dermatophagoides pteronyssinus]|uniref:Uncharacterized protein n=1 Tax=Dermatophagoides pteronyssinus TaxID=6956 RepID=A0ABQ8IS97_DERPT|nr:hypothetical protein DERP_013245 [Dermatophagoides pteronyssinus]
MAIMPKICETIIIIWIDSFESVSIGINFSQKMNFLMFGYSFNVINIVSEIIAVFNYVLPKVH